MNVSFVGPEHKGERSGGEKDHSTLCHRRHSWRVVAQGLKHMALCTPKPALSSPSCAVVMSKAIESQLEGQLEVENLRYLVIHTLPLAAMNIIGSNNCN